MRPSLLNFLAGIAASGSVGLLLVAPQAGSRAAQYLIAGVPWLCISLSLFLLAGATEGRDGDLAVARAAASDAKERQKLIQEVGRAHAGRLRALRSAVLITGVASVAAVIWITASPSIAPCDGASATRSPCQCVTAVSPSPR